MMVQIRTLALGSTVIIFDGDTITIIYQIRRIDEVFYKSLKPNAALAKSPTLRVTTENNYVFVSICAVFKLECSKVKHKANHLALTARLIIRASRRVYAELQVMRVA